MVYCGIWDKCIERFATSLLWWIIVNWTLRNKLQWNFNRDSTISIDAGVVEVLLKGSNKGVHLTHVLRVYYILIIKMMSLSMSTFLAASCSVLFKIHTKHFAVKVIRYNKSTFFVLIPLLACGFDICYEYESILYPSWDLRALDSQPSTFSYRYNWTFSQENGWDRNHMKRTFAQKIPW